MQPDALQAGVERGPLGCPAVPYGSWAGSTLSQLIDSDGIAIAGNAWGTHLGPCLWGSLHRTYVAGLPL